MPSMCKARYSIFYSLLFVFLACEAFTAFGSNLNQTEPRNLQIAESDNPREVLKKTLSAIQSVKSYRIRSEVTAISKDGPIKEYSSKEYASPDRVRTLDKNKELIRIGKDTYQKKGDGRWQKYTEKRSDTSVTNLPVNALEDLIEDLVKVEDIKFIGQETIDGIPTLAYQYRHRSDPNTIKAWIGIADGLLRKWEFECIVEGLKAMSLIFTYYDYNADIKIEPPTEYVSVFAPFNDSVPIILVPVYESRQPPAVPIERSAGGGMGSGKNGGMGSGSGTGVGPGTGFNKGSGDSDFNPDGSAKSVDTKPVPLNRPRPNYTEEARNNKIQGNVRVRALIGADGSVKQVRIITGLPDGLNEEAILAVKQMRFQPATKNGQPVAYWIPLDVPFNLR
jgi:TonB family protein